MGLTVTTEVKAEMTTRAGQRVLLTAVEGSDKVRVAVPAHNYAELTAEELRDLGLWMVAQSERMDADRETALHAARRRDSDRYERLGNAPVWGAR